MDDNVVAIVAVFCIFGLPVFGYMVNRAMQHRERIEMIRSGMVPPAGNAWKSWQRSAPVPPQPAPQRMVAADAEEARCTLRKGIVVTFVGLALTIGLSFIGYDPGPPSSFHPGPWLLGGLIPMFVGLAQVVTALMFGATFPAAASVRYGAAPRENAPNPPPNAQGPYTYRPDPNTQELGQSLPPDRR